MSGKINILFLAKDAKSNQNLPSILRKNGYELTLFQDVQSAWIEMLDRSIEIVIVDLEKTDSEFTPLIGKMRESKYPAKVLILSEKEQFQEPSEILKLGVYDYLWKPVNPVVLLHVVSRVEELCELHQEVADLKEDIKRMEGFGQSIIGNSPEIKAVLKTIDAIAKNRSSVLIQGETGTGKELIAKTIHDRGQDPSLPFVGINCGAFAESLLESQIFGHVRGAYTGAISDHEGVFRAAGNGTLFLDEISEIPMHLQVKFLRALQEREITPLGSKEVYRINARIITAANRDLMKSVKEGKFRDDLFYRLNVVSIDLPALRERREDIPLLTEYFIEDFAAQYGMEKKSITQEAMEKMQAYSWPGNIRELQNVIERSFALSISDKLTLEDLPLPLRAGSKTLALPTEEGELLSLEDQEQLIIAKALRKTKGEKTAAAKLLKIDRNRLARKMVKYGLA